MLPTRTYTVDGMTCGHCRASVIKEVLQVDGVKGVDVDLDAKRLTVAGESEDRHEQNAERGDTSARGRHDASVYPASSTAARMALSSKDSPATVRRLASTWRTSLMTDARQCPQVMPSTV